MLATILQKNVHFRNTFIVKALEVIKGLNLKVKCILFDNQLDTKVLCNLLIDIIIIY